MEEDENYLVRRIQDLENQLRQARNNEVKLRVTNNQLTRMVASSNQAALRKTTDFISNIESIVTQKMKKMPKKSI